MIYNCNKYFGVTFKGGKKELFDMNNDRVYLAKDTVTAKLNSMDFSFYRVDCGDYFQHYYRGQPVEVSYIQTDYKLH